MLRLCCCPARIEPAPPPPPAPLAPLPLDLLADLPGTELPWDSAPLPHDEDDSKGLAEHEEKNGVDLIANGHNDVFSENGHSDVFGENGHNDVFGENGHNDVFGENGHNDVFGDAVSVDIPASEADPPPRRSRSPSVRVEDYSEKSNLSLSREVEASPARSRAEGAERTPSLKSGRSVASEAERRSPSGKSATPPGGSGRGSPAGAGGPGSPAPAREPRDVRSALAECVLPPRHEDWEAVVGGLVETERLAEDAAARAPAASWRAAARNATAHVRSLRSRVARAACRALGALFEHRGRALEPELEEGVAALLDRCADVNRFLRADAARALGQLAGAGGAEARAVAALCRRGAAHRAGPVRAAAAAALARLVTAAGAARVLSLAPDARAALLRSTAELLADASPEARAHARTLALALAEDTRFRPLLKEATPVSRQRAVEKLVDKLQCR